MKKLFNLRAIAIAQALLIWTKLFLPVHISWWFIMLPTIFWATLVLIILLSVYLILGKRNFRLAIKKLQR